MRLKSLTLVMAVGLALLLLVPAGAQARRTQCGNTSRTNPCADWLELLNLNLRHDASAYRTVKGLAKHSKCAEARELADVLLEEWPMKASDSTLQSPRRVDKEHVSRATLRKIVGRSEIRSQILLVRVKVGKTGNPEAVQALNHTDFSALDRAVIAVLTKARFRPARSGSRYVEDTITLTWHLDAY